jgi:major membrane immunogen (membrane-anchored lipoprotein)
VIDRWFKSLLDNVPNEHKFVEINIKNGKIVRSFSERASGKRKATGADPKSSETKKMDLCDLCDEDFTSYYPTGSSNSPVYVDSD